MHQGSEKTPVGRSQVAPDSVLGKSFGGVEKKVIGPGVVGEECVELVNLHGESIASRVRPCKRRTFSGGEPTSSRSNGGETVGNHRLGKSSLSTVFRGAP